MTPGNRRFSAPYSLTVRWPAFLKGGVRNDPNVERYDPDLWTDEVAFLSQPGQADIQSDLFHDYRRNIESYPKWQAWMRATQPRRSGRERGLIC